MSTQQNLLKNLVFILISLTLISVSCIFDTQKKIEEPEKKLLEILYPMPGTKWIDLNTNKIIVKYDPKQVFIPLEHYYCTVDPEKNEDPEWKPIKVDVIGDDTQADDGDTRMRYYVSTWNSSAEPNPPKPGKIWMKIQGYSTSKDIKDVVKDIELE